MLRELTFNDRKKVWLLSLSGLVVLAVFAVGFSNVRHSDSDVLNFCGLLITFTALTLLVVPTRITRLTNWVVYLILLEFGFAQLLCLILEVNTIDTFAVTSLALVGLG